MTTHQKPTQLTGEVSIMKCKSPICKGKARWFDLVRHTEMGEKIYVCQVCGQEQKRTA